MKSSLSCRLALALTMLPMGVMTLDASGAYMFANQTGRDRITHPIGYTGASGQHLIITVSIRPNSPFAEEMEVPVRNAINTWNRLEGRMPNMFIGASTGIPSSHYDFESVLLHEMGHALGLAHPNLASESGLSGSQRDFARSTTGANEVFNLNAGSDGIPGSKEDVRGDDLPMVWYHKATNDPFDNPAIVDGTTYSVNLSDLPAGSLFPAIGSEALSGRLGHPYSEVVMQQGTRSREIQRELTPGCVAHMRLSMSGMDRIEGTEDDYTFELVFVGFSDDSNMPIAFDNTKTAFASAWVGAWALRADTYNITRSELYFNTTYKWYFNQSPNLDVIIPNPDPETTDLLFIY